jgi:hypothetical protein
MAIKCTKWPLYISNGCRIYQPFPFPAPAKFTQIGIFGLKINHLATWGSMMKFSPKKIEEKNGEQFFKRGLRRKLRVLSTDNGLSFIFQVGAKNCLKNLPLAEKSDRNIGSFEENCQKSVALTPCNLVVEKSLNDYINELKTLNKLMSYCPGANPTNVSYNAGVVINCN